MVMVMMMRRPHSRASGFPTLFLGCRDSRVPIAEKTREEDLRLLVLQGGQKTAAATTGWLLGQLPVNGR